MAANPRIEELRRRLEKEPGSRLFAQLAEELRKDGDLSGAIRLCREGLQKHPLYPSARMTLGRALFDTGDLAGGRTEFEQVLKAAPDNILASRFLAECLEGLGDLEGARARYKATLVLSPGDKQVAARLDGVEARLKSGVGSQASGPTAARSGAESPTVTADVEPPPIPVSAADEPFELERPFEAATTRIGTATPPPPAAPETAGASSGRSPAVTPGEMSSELRPIPVVEVEESFELERPYEAPRPRPLSDAAPAPPEPAITETAWLPPAPTTPEPAPAETMAGEDEPEIIEEAYELDGELDPGPPATERAGAPPAPSAPVVEFGFEDEDVWGSMGDEGIGTPAPAPAAVVPPAPPAVVPPAPPRPMAGATELASATLGELYLQQGFLDRAISVYRQVVEREPGNDRARSRLAEIEVLASRSTSAAPPEAGEALPENAASRAARRRTLEQTIDRLEGLLGSIRRG